MTSTSEANAKRRAYNLNKARAKREKKKEELKGILEKVENGETKAPIKGKEKHLPNSQYKESLDGNSFYAQTIRNMIVFYEMEPVENDDELCDRLAWFFEHCCNTGQLITIEKLCLSLGYTTSWLSDVTNGRRQGFSPNTAVILKKAKQFIAGMDGEFALQSKIQPVVYMFRAKNYYDMTDKQEHVITPSNPLSTEVDVMSLEEKYKMLPND